MEPDWEKKAWEVCGLGDGHGPHDLYCRCDDIAQALRKAQAKTWEKAAAHVDPANSGRRWKADLAQDFRDWARSLRTEGKPGASERDWPEDAGHENGCYQERCIRCAQLFMGHKRRALCRVCGGKPGKGGEAGRG